MGEIYCNAFFKAPNNQELQDKLDSESSVFYSNACLLYGPPQSGKSSLAFQYAYSHCAGFSGKAPGNVMYFGFEEKLESTIVSWPEGFSSDPSILSRIAYKYMKTDKELRQMLAGITLFPVRPEFIVVDDFSRLFESYSNNNQRSAAFCRTLALLVDTVQFLNGQSGDNSPKCSALICDDQDSASRSLYLYNRYIQLRIGITPLATPFTFSLQIQSYRGQTVAELARKPNIYQYSFAKRGEYKLLSVE